MQRAWVQQPGRCVDGWQVVHWVSHGMPNDLPPCALMLLCARHSPMGLYDSGTAAGVGVRALRDIRPRTVLINYRNYAKVYTKVCPCTPQPPTHS